MCIRWLGVLAALSLAVTAQHKQPLQTLQPLTMSLPLIAEGADASANSGAAGAGAGAGVDLLSLLSGHGLLSPSGHALSRKSVRSPSRRLRFGRTDPDMRAAPPESELEPWLPYPWRIRRAPLRLRFGRRSAVAAAEPEVMSPLLFAPESNELPQMDERELRSPSMRLRFGRSGRGDDQDSDAPME